MQGNHDENAIRHSVLSNSIDDTAEIDSSLDIEAIEYLKGLPLTRSFTSGQTTVLLALATPSENGGPVFQDSAYGSLSNRFKKDLARMESVLLIVGHTHFPFDIRYNGKRVLNPGSVCNLQGRDSHTYGILDLTSQGFWVLELATGSSIEILVREYI